MALSTWDTPMGTDPGGPGRPSRGVPGLLGRPSLSPRGLLLARAACDFCSKLLCAWQRGRSCPGRLLSSRKRPDSCNGLCPASLTCGLRVWGQEAPLASAKARPPRGTGLLPGRRPTRATLPREMSGRRTPVPAGFRCEGQCAQCRFVWHGEAQVRTIFSKFCIMYLYLTIL